MTRIPLHALGGHCLNVVVSGAGPAVVALHGFTGSLATWQSLRQASSGGYSLVGVDMPGHGDSDCPVDGRLYEMPHTVRALAELLDHLQLDRVHWLGYSMGGRIALAAAITLPQRTASLILESASPGLADPDQRNERVRSDNTLADRIEREGVASFVEYWESLPMWASQSRLSTDVRARQREQRLVNSPTGLANSLRGIGAGAQPSFHSRLPDIHFPVLVIAGEADQKYSAIADEMHRAISGSRLEIVAEAGHNVHLEQPDVFNRVVLDFLRGVAPDSIYSSWRSR